MFLAKPASILRADVNPEAVNPFPNVQKKRWM
jgi:hypothetical protein